jgi:type II secretory pathway component PulK
MSRDRRFQRQRGSVLIVSMVVLVLISAMAGRMVYQVRLELQIQQQANVLTGLRAVARGAAHQFAGFLSTHVEETSNGPTLPWWIEEGGLAPLTLSGGEAVLVAGFPKIPGLADEGVREDDEEKEDGDATEAEIPEGLVDAEAYLNINTATPEQLMAFPGFSNVIAEAIVSHRESLIESGEFDAGLQDDTEGAESGDAAALHYVGAPFRSVRDLLQVEGVTEEMLYEPIAELDAALVEFLTCCSNGRINLNTAPHRVLMGAGFSEEEANVLVAERDGGTHFEDLSIFGTVLPQIEDEERRQRLEGAITVRSSTFPLTVEAHGAAGNVVVKLVARVFLDEKSARFVSWREI